MRRVVTVTLNPALDASSAIDLVEPGVKLRCDPPRFDPGGGGVNVSRAIGKLGGASHAFIANGGPSGLSYRALLEREMTSDVLATHWFEVPGNTRQSLAVFDRSIGKQYRLLLPGPDWDAVLLAECLEALGDLVGVDDLVVLSGSLPPGVPASVVADLCALCVARGADPVLDLSGHALAYAAGNSDPGALLLRMNRHEAGELIGVDEADPGGAERLGRDLVARGAAKIAAIALGSRGGVVISADEAWRIKPPEVDFASATGAGDSYLAGFCLGLANGWTLERTAGFATACAADAVRTEATDLCSRAGVEELLADVQTRRL